MSMYQGSRCIMLPLPHMGMEEYPAQHANVGQLSFHHGILDALNATACCDCRCLVRSSIGSAVTMSGTGSSQHSMINLSTCLSMLNVAQSIPCIQLTRSMRMPSQHLLLGHSMPCTPPFQLLRQLLRPSLQSCMTTNSCIEAYLLHGRWTHGT